MSTTTPSRPRKLAWVLLAGAAIAFAVSLVWLVAPDRTVPAPTVPPSVPAMSPVTGGDVVATRVVIASLGIDLPVVSGDVSVPDQGPAGYPPCDVALYMPTFSQPGEPGATYLYAHARPGMFLPLLEASEKGDDGESLVGTRVDVYTSDDVRHTYEVRRVKRHALDLALAQDIPARSERLVLQTSEGPRGTAAKLQLLAVPRSTRPVDQEEAQPVAAPRGCYDD